MEEIFLPENYRVTSHVWEIFFLLCEKQTIHKKKSPRNKYLRYRKKQENEERKSKICSKFLYFQDHSFHFYLNREQKDDSWLVSREFFSSYFVEFEFECSLINLGKLNYAVKQWFFFYFSFSLFFDTEVNIVN
jgi:hypothetical protein